MSLLTRHALPFAFVLAGLAAAFACKGSSGGSTCDPVCDGVDDCGGTSCLAYCIGLRTACTAHAQDTAFSDWAGCVPKLTCVSGAFTATSCPLQVVETLTCGYSADGVPDMESSAGTATSSSNPSTSFNSSGTGTGVTTDTGFSSNTSTGVTTETGTDSESSTSSSSVCGPIAEACTVGTDCCSNYCKSGVCSCNTIGYACQAQVDCCGTYVCNNGTCVGNASTQVICQACGTGVDGGVACNSPRHCLSDDFGNSYCAQDCTTNANSCPLDMTCTEDGDGTSACIPNSGACVTSTTVDAG